MSNLPKINDIAALSDDGAAGDAALLLRFKDSVSAKEKSIYLAKFTQCTFFLKCFFLAVCLYTMPKEIATYIFKYNGELVYMDVNTLITSQYHFVNILNEIKEKVAPEKNLKLKVKPLPKGSFQLEWLLAVDFLESIFTRENINDVANIIEIFVGLIFLREFLKGKKPDSIKEGDSVVIVVKDGAELSVNKTVYELHATNITIDKSFNEGFKVIEKDEEITGLEMKKNIDDEVPIVSVPRMKFSAVAEKNEVSEDKQRTIIKPDAKLRIFRIVFGEGYKWQFYYEGNKITASVNDESFIGNALNGTYSFSNGDLLIADLSIKQLYDERVNDFINKEYTILAVRQHIPRGKQDNLFITD